MIDDPNEPGAPGEVSHRVQPLSDIEIDCAAVHDMVHDYVLSAVADEGLRIEQHCDRCPRCREFVDGLQATASLLAFSAPQELPPLSAKAALFTRLAQATRDQERAPSLFLGQLGDLTSPTLPTSERLETEVRSDVKLPLPGRRSWVASYAAPLATLPLLLALGFVGYWGMNTRLELNDQLETVDELNNRVQLLNSRIDSISGGIADVDEYFTSGTAKQYAMLDPEPDAGDAQSYGMLWANPRSNDAVLMAWNLDPSVDSYQVVLELTSGDTMTISDLYCDGKGSVTKTLDLGIPLSQVASIHVKPAMNGISTDSQLASTLPDALYATIWPGIGREQDIASGQQP